MSTPAPPTKPIIVGVDGSESSTRAVRWAAREAALRRRPLKIVNSYSWPLSGYPDGVFISGDLYETLRANSDSVLREAKQAAESTPDLQVSTVSLTGNAQLVLRELSQDAELVVIGSRGLGGFTGLLLGSTAVGLASRADCPVVVVRGTREPTDGPIVLGTDAGALSEAATAFAFEEAALRAAPLLAVHAWQETGVDVAMEAHVPVEFWRTAGEHAEELVAERLAGWREKYAGVEVTIEVHGASPAEQLVHHSEQAQLVVVGSRGRGGFTGLTLGSTSQTVLRHAAAPVIVVRAEKQAR